MMMAGAAGGGGRRVLQLFISITLVCVVVSAQNPLPGVKITLNQRGLDYAREVGVAYVTNHFQTINVPDQNGKAGAGILGTIDWGLTSIVLSGLSVPNSVVSLQTNTSITLALSGLTMSGEMNFNYRQEQWPNVSGGGSLSISVSNTYVAVSASLGELNGHPSFNVLSATCSMGSLDITVHGGASWFYQIVIDIIHGVIQNAAQNAVSSAISNIIDTAANQALQGVPMQEVFDNNLAEIDYSFVAAPKIGQDTITFNGRGEFYLLPGKQEAPMTPLRMPDNSSQLMLQVFVSDYVPNTASYTFWKAGVMKGQLQDKDLPSWSPVRLNTSDWQILIPGLYKMYPGLLMVVDISPIVAPAATFSSSGIAVQGVGQAVISVVMPGSGQLNSTFAIGINISSSASVNVTDGRLYASLSYLNATSALLWSKVGDVNLSGLKLIIDAFNQEVVLPFFNFYLSHGVGIPTIPGVTFNNPSLGYGDGFLSMSTDITYNPQLSSSIMIN